MNAASLSHEKLMGAIELIGTRVAPTVRAKVVARCARCDHYEISISRIEELHRLIARILIDKSSALRVTRFAT